MKQKSCSRGIRTPITFTPSLADSSPLIAPASLPVVSSPLATPYPECCKTRNDGSAHLAGSYDCERLIPSRPRFVQLLFANAHSVDLFLTARGCSPEFQKHGLRANTCIRC